MQQLLGIFFSLGATISWAFGDFNIQRSTREIGIWKSLLYIGGLGSVLLLPFVWTQLPGIFSDQRTLVFLILTSFVVVWAAQFNFTALRKGKLSVIVPITGLELPITVLISVFLIGESISLLEGGIITAVFLGLMLLVTKHGAFKLERIHLEKGVLYGLVGAVGMALVNVSIGLCSREFSPLVTIWFTHTFAALYCVMILTFKGELKFFSKDFHKDPKTLLLQSILDNFAWICYAYATTFISIAVVITISECYIALAAILGMRYNCEKLKMRQSIGMIIAILGIVILSAIAG